MLRNARVVIPAGFVLVLVAALAVVIGLLRSRDADMLVVHTLEVQQSAQTLLINVRDAETAKRSYLLTGAPDYLESFAGAMAAIRPNSPNSASSPPTTTISRSAWRSLAL